MNEQEIFDSNRLAQEADAAARELMLKKYDVKSLDEFPPELLAHIFSFVGSKSSNPAPPDYINYINSKSMRDFHVKIDGTEPRERKRRTASTERKDWEYKKKQEYAVRNLMTLRRVCTAFENVINNEMVPGKHFDFVLIDVRLQGNRGGIKHGAPFSTKRKKPKNTDSRQVTFFKYGGNGSVIPATRLSRVRRFNELEFEHIQKFERIRDIRISDMVLNEELFETILRLDLTTARKIVFERIQGFDESINIKDHVKNFLNNVNTSARVYFNSEVFDPDTYLFEEGERVGREDEEEQMEWDSMSSESYSSDDSDDEANARRAEANRRRGELRGRRLEADLRRWEEEMRRERENDRIERDIRAIETMNVGRDITHHWMRIGKPKAEDFEFRRYRALQMINNALSSNEAAEKIEINWFNYATNYGVKNLSKRLINSYKSQMKSHAPIVQKAGKYHLNKLFKILAKNDEKGARSVVFHSKRLKKIVTSASDIGSEEQEQLVRCYVESEEQRKAMAGFSFMKKYKMKSRNYVGPARPPRRN
ncbi:hypothetical protein CAEBREN_24333 [Caenorhabditis brenneri]|uniref:Uncharacterized protein n=1 Tax=Caenorhabditis brenneri TaxID=135651 RepID=G0NF91_CAEBE|nr:hypothetical protein CAEBREN_24333 [Caenorhabditis brenneri]